MPRPKRLLVDVNVLPQEDGAHEIVACFLPDPFIPMVEGNSSTCFGIDPSGSMKSIILFSPITFSKPQNYVESVARKTGATLF
jgi:hypothetical protein